MASDSCERRSESRKTTDAGLHRERETCREVTAAGDGAVSSLGES